MRLMPNTLISNIRRTSFSSLSSTADVYNETRGGLPGNDDSGTMSSWYVWGAIGLYPNAGQPFYYIGSPVFRRVSIDLGSGRTFIIDAPESSDANRYVQGAELNRKPLNRALLTDRKSTRLNSSHLGISYAVFC